MANRKNNLYVTILCFFVVIPFLYLIIKNLANLLFQNNVKNFSNNSSIIATNFVDQDEPILSNSEYKKSISCNLIPEPSPDGIRVNYYNSHVTDVN